jgi:regulatory protein
MPHPRTPDPTILRAEPLRPRGLRVRHLLDRGEPLEVALEALERMALGVGDALPAHRRHHLLDADADVRIRDAALSLLSHRARTRADLRRRLVAKGFRPARVDPALDRLEARGLLDDAALAAAFVRDRLRHRPRGQVRLAQELRAKGVRPELAERVVEDVLADEEVSEADLARRVVEGWLSRQGAATLEGLTAPRGTPAAEKARRRLHGYLARRGFRGATLGQAVDTALALARTARSPRPGS